MATYLGVNAKAYYRSAGSYGSPTRTEISSIADLMEDVKFAEAEANSRLSMVDLAEPSTMQLSWTGTVKNDGSAAWTALYLAFLTRAAVDMWFLNGPDSTNGVTGYRAMVKIFDLSQDQGRSVRLYNTFLFKPCEDDNLPKRVLVAGGVPTYAPIDGATLVFA